MADFRQLALEFVLADDEPVLARLAREAASEISIAAANTHPVARWVESVQPWMPGGSGDDMSDGAEENTNWTARAKALEFLSRTLDQLNPDVLKPSQVKLLIAFFGAMFDVDHKAGILASASALSRIIAMRAFQPQSASDIITKVCALKDDFPRQISKTRAAVYNLIRSLIMDAAVAKDLRTKQPSSQFMLDLLTLCANERDPDCLMIWFEILAFFSREYEPSQEVLEKVYDAFKAYFPITLPRTSPSGITPEDLKLRLRTCFSSNYRLAASVYPFLLGRLDQGDGVTINVKLDVLKTLRACSESHDKPEESVTPYVNQIWGSLKYEVRNGEIEDTIWATLEVLKTLALRLSGDDLRDYTLTVTRDCINDLSNPTYTASAGRLLISVLSANPSAFALMVAPAVTHIKENLRHPKSPKHSSDLLKLLHVILETRVLLVKAGMTAQESGDFGSTDVMFKSLYNDIFKSLVASGLRKDQPSDELNVVVQAVQGVGALVCQRSSKSPAIEVASQADFSRLVPDQTCLEICDGLFGIATQSTDNGSRAPDRDELVNEAVKALQRVTVAFPEGFTGLKEQALQIIRGSWSNQVAPQAEVVQTIGPMMAFVGCSELPSNPTDGMSRFLQWMVALSQELLSALDAEAAPEVWCALAVGIQSTIRYFNEACLSGDSAETTFSGESWITYVATSFPLLTTLERDDAGLSGAASSHRDSSVAKTRNDALLCSLYVGRLLYRRVAQVVKSESSQRLELALQPSAETSNIVSQFLYLLSGLVGITVHEMSDSLSSAVQVERFAVNMFQEESVSIQDTAASNSQPELAWVMRGDLNQLSLGLIENLRPSAVSRLFDYGVGQALILAGVSPAPQPPGRESVTQSMLTILANKSKIETMGPLMTELVTRVDQAAPSSDSQSGSLNSIIAIVTGMLRRYAGQEASPLISAVLAAPKLPDVGFPLARRLEMLFSPHEYLTSDSFALVRKLWMRKAYFQIVRPMLEEATISQDDKSDQLRKSNIAVAVLLMAKHVEYTMYEEDVDQLLRLAISTAQTIDTSPETVAALEIIKTVLTEAPEKLQDHIRSLVDVCFDCIYRRKKAAGWLPEDYYSFTPRNTAMYEISCGKLALEVLGALPGTFESRFLVPLSRRVQRELMLACGNGSRDARRSARLARAAWDKVN